MLSLLLSLTVATLQPSFASPEAQAQGAPPATTSPAPANPVAGKSPADNRTYVIGPQDVLKITVFEEPTLSGTYRVAGDGSFDYPYIDRVEAAGKTQREIEDEITKRLADGYVKRPQVTVEVEQFRSRSIFVAGEVQKPAKYPLTGQMTLMEALVQAGFLTQNAGTYVVITRTPESPANAPEQVKVTIADVQAGRREANVLLREGDSILVPRAEKFYVSGFVKSPGAYTHEPGMSVLQALSLAGGVSEKGSTRGIKVKRKMPGKVKVKDAVTKKDVERDGVVEKELGISLEDEVLPGDTIIVRQRLL